MLQAEDVANKRIFGIGSVRKEGCKPEIFVIFEKEACILMHVYIRDEFHGRRKGEHKVHLAYVHNEKSLLFCK